LVIGPIGGGWYSKRKRPDWQRGFNIASTFEDAPDWKEWAAFLPDDLEPWVWVEDRADVQLLHRRRGPRTVTLSVALPGSTFDSDESTAQIFHAALDRLYRHVATRRSWPEPPPPPPMS
jgi:hypothetical protein